MLTKEERERLQRNLCRKRSSQNIIKRQVIRENMMEAWIQRRIDERKQAGDFKLVSVESGKAIGEAKV